MNSHLAELALRRSQVAVLPKSETPASNEEITDFIFAMAEMGWAFEKDSFDAILNTSQENLRFVQNASQGLLNDGVFQPMYKNFPKEVQEASDWELYFNAFVHYVTAYYTPMTVVPVRFQDPNRTALKKIKPRSLKAVSDDYYNDVAASIVTQGQPYSDTDKEDLVTLKNYLDDSLQVPIRENLAHLAVAFAHGKWTDQFVTLTDVLRYSVALSQGNPSLEENVRFKLPRRVRRNVLADLARVLRNNHENYEDFTRHSEMWKRLMKTLHPHENPDPIVHRAADAVYHETARSFASQVEEAFKNDVHALLDLLSTRPGEFARSLARALRTYPDSRREILSSFEKVAQNVSLRVLIQMYNHFSSPTSDELPEFVAQYKSRTQNSVLVPNKLVGDYSDVLDAIETGMAGRLSDKKIAVDLEDADQYAIPMGVRSASPSLRAIGRGSRVKLRDSDADSLRFFMHWKNDGDRRVDLDLSAFFVNEDFTNSKQIAYYNLRDSNIETYHSGDIVDAPEGASEYVDVNIEKALKAGYRYVAMTVHNYTGQPLVNVPEAWAGVMARNGVNSGEIFEPSTVEMRYDLTSESRTSIPFVFDMETKELIWWDASLNIHQYLFNLDSSASAMSIGMKGLVKSYVMTVSDLLQFADAQIVPVEDADFELNGFETEKVLNLI